MAPKLATPCSALPPVGVQPPLGRPAGRRMAPKRATPSAVLPPEGEQTP
ncbi:MAG: hypothetical protein JWP65_3, partial [Ramlibacter sp.]|nr:hypothetical protein [Ramlibacter sp.]